MNKRMITVVVGLVLALVIGPLAAQARYLNPNTGRFQTMDSYEGNSQEPLSLHKYLYAQANPINRVDPSGLADYNLTSLMTAASIIGIQASQYISRVPAMAATAFRGGGQAIGQFFNQFGAVVQNFGQQTINLLPRIQSFEPVLEGCSRRPDFLLRAGNALRAIEGKYRLPTGGEALSRMGSQIQQFSQWASQGANREVVVWALKSSENFANVEQAVLQAAGNPQGVRFVYGVEGFFQYLLQWAGM